jgi:glycine cleavage system H protein
MYFFSKNHIWITVDGPTARLGVSDYAQSQLGGIVFLNLPDIGETLSVGERFGDIESVKTVSDLISPIDGVVTAVNDDLVDAPDAINSAPYESWFVEATITSTPNNLMEEVAYSNYLKTL